MRTGMVMLAAALLLAGCGWFGEVEESERPVGEGQWAVESPPETVEEAHALAEELSLATIEHLGFEGMMDEQRSPLVCSHAFGEITAGSTFTMVADGEFDGLDPDAEAVARLLADAEAYWESRGVTALEVVGEGGRVPMLVGRFEPLGQVSFLVNRDSRRGFVYVNTGCLVSENWEDYQTGGGLRPPSQLDAEHADLYGDGRTVIGGDLEDADPEEPERDR